MGKNTARACASCLASCEGNDEGIAPEPAAFYVEGTVPVDDTRRRPYRGYLCAEHEYAMVEDGAIWTRKDRA